MAEMADAVAIVGMAVTFPKAPDLATYRDNIVTGVDAISDVPETRWDSVFYDPKSAGVDRFYCRKGGFIDDEALVDPLALGVVPAAVRAAEPDQLLALSLAAQALADAGADALEGRAETAGVIVGRGGYLTPGLARLDQRVRVSEQLVGVLRSLLPGIDEGVLGDVKEAFVAGLGPVGPDTAIDLVPNLAASRIANRLDLAGPAYTVDAACASSLVAVDNAVRELALGRCDLVVAGGVHLCHDVTLWSVFTQLKALSRMESIRPFDQSADGLLIGEGGGMVVLERLADAERRGAHIYAVVRGSGVSSDGRDASLMRPSVAGQVLALQRAWDEAALDPAELGLLEAHGTATPAGDAAELETIRRFFGPPAGTSPRAVLGSVKSMIGHTMPAAGIAGLVKVALALDSGIAPPTLHCDDPHPLMAETRFEPVGEAREWAAGSGELRVGAVSAFGFGGINAHVVLTSHPASRSSSPAARRSAGDAPAVERTAGAVAAGYEDQHLDDNELLEDLEPVLVLAAPSVGELVERFEAWVGRGDGPGQPGPLPEESGPCRLAVVAPTPERIELVRKVLERDQPWRGRNDIWFTNSPLLDEAGAKLVFLFPGVEPTFEPRVDDVARWLGEDPPELAGPDAPANDLEGLGRSLIAVGRLLDAATIEVGLRPDIVAGQSIGEWSGMIATEMIPPEEIDGFIETLRPGSLEVPGVAFAALGCDVTAAERLFEDRSDVYVSHDNCPRQTILCGGDEAISTVLIRAKEAKILGQLLPFRSGFHTPLFAPFVEPFRTALARLPLQQPQVPLWSATTCDLYPPDPSGVRDLALAHLVERVRFRELVLALHAAGGRVFVQIGAGGLSGLVEDTLRGEAITAVPVNSTRRPGRAQLLRAGLACWVEGRRGITVDRLAHPARAVSGDEGGSAGQATATQQARHGARQRLGLGAPLVHLPATVAEPLAKTLAEHFARSDADRARPFAGPPPWEEIGRPDDPVLAELAALWEDLGNASADVQQALHAAVTRSRSGEPAATQAEESEDAAGADGASLGVAVRTVPLSLDSHPELIDHCFYRQPPGWPADADRFPVVPMTGLIDLMVDAAVRLCPDLTVVGAEDVRALRWLAVAPPVEVVVRAEELPVRDGEHDRRVRVVIEGYARATVVLGSGYAAPPAPATAPLLDPEPVPVTPAGLYDDRWLFHGPRYRGVRVLGPMSEEGIDGELEAGSAIGSLLDNAGQLMGFWIMYRHELDRLGLPTTIDRITFFGPHPEVGERLSCAVRILSVTGSAVRADLELCSEGRVWARISGWEDKRFDSDGVVWPVLIWPEHSALSEVSAGGCHVAVERWRSSASRELMMRRYLGESERAEYARHNPRAQRLFLLGRIAATDAVRSILWESGETDVWPVEVEIGNEQSGRPVVRVRGRDDIHVSIAHTPWMGVALAAVGGEVGVDAENVEPRSESFRSAAFSPAELATILAGRPVEEHDELLARAWAAKEAVGKALGTGLAGRPKDFEITACDPDRIVVNGRTVGSERIGDIVVAWTRGGVE
jgi:acyl transferase domain-containing protein/phosphopantetheinyl transferase